MADSSRLNPVSAHDVKKGSVAILKGHPCKIVEVKVSKTGKHGHAKCNITGVSLINGKKYNEVKPGHIQMHQPDIVKAEVTFSHIEDETVHGFDDQMEEVHVNATPEQIEQIEKLEEELADDEEICLVTQDCPTFMDEKESSEIVISEIKKQKAP
eukprot:CAMPEP_0183360712 /NCGR_PEP_ID=MMETSP0164_2-20130417/55961_1 /TAXON_ID=221442 /ORGANISM="Coccolithus pelagicus ssp braarudi, Strain PLY182g" /LENGTH=154 /DNA_ID=CAMNT_0025535133 /DNA_START=46 /DNA_END=510 /DNA_ORIENTATION=+